MDVVVLDYDVVLGVRNGIHRGRIRMARSYLGGGCRGGGCGYRYLQQKNAKKGSARKAVEVTRGVFRNG